MITPYDNHPHDAIVILSTMVAGQPAAIKRVQTAMQWSVSTSSINERLRHGANNRH